MTFNKIFPTKVSLLSMYQLWQAHNYATLDCFSQSFVHFQTSTTDVFRTSRSQYGTFQLFRYVC